MISSSTLTSLITGRARSSDRPQTKLVKLVPATVRGPQHSG